MNPTEAFWLIAIGIIAFYLIDVFTSKVIHGVYGGGHVHDHNHDHSVQEKELQFMSVSIINLVGDCLHNFTDGLAISVAFQASKYQCILTDYRLYYGSNYYNCNDDARVPS
jgi:zinc transporter ZupT